MTSPERRPRSRQQRWVPLLALLAFAAAVPALAGAPPGAAACSGCHAAAASTIPPIAGRSAETITADMRAFRAGERPSTVMGRIAKGFSDDETRAIAEWLVAQPR